MRGLNFQKCDKSKGLEKSEGLTENLTYVRIRP